MIAALGRLVRREPEVAAVLFAGTVALSAVGVVRGIWFVWVYLPALVASVGIVVVIDHLRGPIPGILLWLLAAWALLHLAGGLAANPKGDSEILYGMWIVDGVLRFDQVVHGFGIGVATATLAYATRESSRPLLWGFVLAQGIGAVNEAAENVFAVFVEDSNVGDVYNTLGDLAWHLIGSAIAAGWMVRRGIPGVAAGVGSMQESPA